MIVYNGDNQLILVATQMGCCIVVLNLSAFVQALVVVGTNDRVLIHQSRIYKEIFDFKVRFKRLKCSSIIH